MCCQAGSLPRMGLSVRSRRRITLVLAALWASAQAAEATLTDTQFMSMTSILPWRIEQPCHAWHRMSAQT